MLSESSKPLVLVAGATGNTGQAVVDALLKSGAFRIAALTRPKSQSKPIIDELRTRGVEIRVGDFVNESVETLQDALVGVDIVLSIVSARALAAQKTLFQAAKNVGVKRVIPCDFGTACPPGRRHLHDEKLAIRTYVRALGVPYTFIDIGWWMELILPHPSWSTDWLAGNSHHLYGTGAVRTAVTSLFDIGPFVTRVIADPRTVDRYVFCWSEQVTLDEVCAVGSRVSGEDLRALMESIPADEILKRAAHWKAEYAREPSVQAFEDWLHYEYAYSLYVMGDNTVETAKALGALDARELYPDFKPMTLTERAEIFYKEIPAFTLNL